MPVQLSCYSVCSSPSWPTSSTTGELMSLFYKASFWEFHKRLIMYNIMYSMYKNHPTSLLLLVTAFFHEIIAASAWIEKNCHSNVRKQLEWKAGNQNLSSCRRMTPAHNHVLLIAWMYCFNLHKSCTFILKSFYVCFKFCTVSFLARRREVSQQCKTCKQYGRCRQASSPMWAHFGT